MDSSKYSKRNIFLPSEYRKCTAAKKDAASQIASNETRTRVDIRDICQME